MALSRVFRRKRPDHLLERLDALAAGKLVGPLHAWEAIHAELGLPGPVVIYALLFLALAKFLVLFAKVLVQGMAVALEIIVGNGEAARGGALVHVYEDDGARAGDEGNLVVGHKGVEFGGSVFERSAMAPDTHDSGRAGKGHEQDTDAAIARLVQVSVCFYPATGQVHVPEGALVDHAKVLAAFGGDVDVAMAGEGGGADPEHLLLLDPGEERSRNGLIEDAHDGRIVSCKRRRSVKLKKPIARAFS